MDNDAGVSSPESLPAGDDVQRVEAERMDDGQYRFGRRADSNAPRPEAAYSPLKPPITATWICLAAAWLFLGSSVPFTVVLGVPLALIAILLGAVCLSRGSMLTGIAVLALGSVGSFVVYLVGLFRFLAG